MVNIMKINAWIKIISTWNIVQTKPNGTNAHQGNKAIKTKINSPANKLPNSRNDSEIGFAISSTKRKITLTGNNHQPNGREHTSFNRPTPPLDLKLKKIQITNTLRDIANVRVGSAVGTNLKCSTPKKCKPHGTRSTGIKSMKFIRKTHIKMVSASGATMRRLP